MGFICHKGLNYLCVQFTGIIPSLSSRKGNKFNNPFKLAKAEHWACTARTQGDPLPPFPFLALSHLINHNFKLFSRKRIHCIAKRKFPHLHNNYFPVSKVFSYLLKVSVTVNVLSLMRILQIVTLKKWAQEISTKRNSLSTFNIKKLLHAWFVSPHELFFFNFLTLMYCQIAFTITGLVCVWIPMRRASLGSSLYWGG